MDYQISLDYDDYFKCSNMIKAVKIEVVGDSILFFTDAEGLKFLNENNISYMLHQNKKEKKKQYKMHYSGIAAAIILVIFLVVMNYYRVSEITFSGNYPINEPIKKMIEDGYKSILVFDFHSNNYEELSKKARVAFKEYEWISISKEGSKIVVNVEPTTTNEYQKDEKVLGNIVAVKDGVVSQFIAFDGKVMVEDNLYVKAGDVLIDGTLLGARGYVLGITYEEVSLSIDKEVLETTLTGNKSDYYEINIFKQSFYPFKDQNYQNSEVVKSKSFTIPYLLSVNKIVEYEKDDIIYVYDKDDAISYAKSLIEENFEANRVLNEEKILLQQVILVNETETSFEIKLMIKKEESIGVFKSIA